MIARTNQLSLADRFAGQGEAFANRASTVFPVLVRPHCDTIIVFLDYWRLKNGVAGVACFVRVYDGDGRLAVRQIVPIDGAHNEISLAGVLRCDRFDGMVELEFISDRNLVFNFPAILAFYRSGEFYSAVHAAGRARNPDERHVPARSTETNWTCKLGADVVPFFHLFNGPRTGGIGDKFEQHFAVTPAITNFDGIDEPRA